MKSTHKILWTLVFCLICTFNLISQTNDIDRRPVAQTVFQLIKNKTLEVMPLFAKTSDQTVDTTFNEKVRIDILSVDESLKNRIIDSDHSIIEIELPVKDGKEWLSLQLYAITLITPNSRQWSSLQKSRKYFRGIIKGQHESLVTLNFGINGISGIISSPDKSFVIQPAQGSKNKIAVVEESILKNKRHFECHTSYDPSRIPLPNYSADYSKSTALEDTVKMYFECDYDMYVNNNQSTSQTLDYLFGLFNEIGAIYENENIVLLIEDYFIWTTPDPYSDNSAANALQDFHDRLGANFEGHVAQLLSGNSNNIGGLAVVNTVCNKATAHSYANIEGQFNPITSYSWDVHVVSHELGHNLGSPHTHDCVWGPNQNEALDNCAIGGNCSPGPPPVNGGTIMSYCHSTPEGVNFSLGFGLEPGNLIRNIIGSCPDLNGYICLEATNILESGTYEAPGPSLGQGATHPPADHANWFSFVAPTEGTISINSCDQGVDTRLYLYAGSCVELTEIATGDDECSTGNGNNYASEILGYAVIQNQTYYLEWDNRWSSDGFNFDFIFTPDQAVCDNSSSMSSPVMEDSDYHSSNALIFEGIVSNGAMLTLSSDSSIVLLPGFIIDSLSQLEVHIESCDSFNARTNQ